MSDIVERLRHQRGNFGMLRLDAVAEIERLQDAFSVAHGALLCIGGTDSNWSEYARNVANEAAAILTQETNGARTVSNSAKEYGS